jgi:hypothetical protein
MATKLNESKGNQSASRLLFVFRILVVGIYYASIQSTMAMGGFGYFAPNFVGTAELPKAMSSTEEIAAIKNRLPQPSPSASATDHQKKLHPQSANKGQDASLSNEVFKSRF